MGRPLDDPGGAPEKRIEEAAQSLAIDATKPLPSPISAAFAVGFRLGYREAKSAIELAERLRREPNP